jgi:membrane dipeptidase
MSVPGSRFQTALIIDGDYPMAYSAMDLDRDLTLPIQQVRAAQPGRFVNPDWPDRETMASLPEMRKGNIAVAAVKVVGRIAQIGSPLSGYRTGELAYAGARGQLAYYEALARRGEVKLVKDSEHFRQHIANWENAEDCSQFPVGLILGMEGADPILSPDYVRHWWDDGVRVVSLSHYGISTYGHGTGTGLNGGLFPAASSLLAEMESVGMILDLTHSSDASAREAADKFGGALLASHQNCRAITPGERQFPDDLLRTIIDRNGVVGVSFDSWMLYTREVNWAKPTLNRRAVFARDQISLEHVVNHIDHICQLAGNAKHVGIGSDTDGQGGCEGAPIEIDTVADFYKLADVLSRRGYTDDDVIKVLHGNWYRFFKENLPARDSSSIAGI